VVAMCASKCAADLTTSFIHPFVSNANTNSPAKAEHHAQHKRSFAHPALASQSVAPTIRQIVFEGGTEALPLLQNSRADGTRSQVGVTEIVLTARRRGNRVWRAA